MKIDIQGMKDSRSKQIGQRIRAERKKKGWSQGELGVQITDMLGATNPDGRVKSQGNVSEWETGSRIPTFENLLCLSTLFNCDLGYLLCDYDGKAHNEDDIAKETGLSIEATRTLISCKHWGITDAADVLNALLLDLTTNYTSCRAVLDLLHYFFSYHCIGTQKQIFSSGRITKAETDGYISTSAIRLDDRTIEYAVLMNIQEALIRLKNTISKDSEGKTWQTSKNAATKPDG